MHMLAFFIPLILFSSPTYTEGLSGVLPVELLSLFTTGEVEAIVCGVPTVDISVLQKATEYEGVSPQDRHIQVGRYIGR